MATTPAPHGPIQRVELRDAVAIEIRELILNGEFVAGERLIETELADRFGTSRGPVRDALADLEQSGLVVSINRRGSFVAQLTVDDVAELYAVRSALESLATAQAIERATPADTATLQDRLTELDRAALDGDARAIAEADMRFHRTIVELAGNNRLIDAWSRLADQTVLLMRELSHINPEIQGPAGDHHNIVAAFAAGDPIAGAEAIQNHLAAARDALSSRFGHPDQ